MVLAWRPPNSPFCLGLLAGISAAGCESSPNSGWGRGWDALNLTGSWGPEPPSTRAPEGHPNPQKLASPRCFHRCGQTLTLGGMSCVPPPHPNRGGTWGAAQPGELPATLRAARGNHISAITNGQRGAAAQRCPQSPAGQPPVPRRGGGSHGGFSAPTRAAPGAVTLVSVATALLSTYNSCPGAPTAVRGAPVPTLPSPGAAEGGGRSTWSSTGFPEKSHPHRPLTTLLGHQC